MNISSGFSLLKCETAASFSRHSVLIGFLQLTVIPTKCYCWIFLNVNFQCWWAPETKFDSPYCIDVLAKSQRSISQNHLHGKIPLGISRKIYYFVICVHWPFKKLYKISWEGDKTSCGAMLRSCSILHNARRWRNLWSVSSSPASTKYWNVDAVLVF